MGYYFLDANAFNDFDVVLGPTGDLIGLPGLNANTVGDVDTETWSLFADFSYDLNDYWSVSLGVPAWSGPAMLEIGGSGIVAATTSDFDGSEEWTEFTPRASINWMPSDENSIYFSYSEGFKGGSFDPRGQTSAAPDLDGDGVGSVLQGRLGRRRGLGRGGFRVYAVPARDSDFV